MPRALFIIDNLSPYHAARLNEIQKHLQLSCLEVFKESSVYSWSQTKKLFPVHVLQSSQFCVFRIRRLIRFLEKSNPNIIYVTGWSRTADVAALIWSAYKKIPIIIMSDSNQSDFKRYFVIEWLKSKLISCVSGALCAGIRSNNYLQNLGIKKDKILGLYNVVDNDHFKKSSQKFIDQKQILIVARLVRKKNLEFFLRVYLHYIRECLSRSFQPWKLCIVGEGPLARNLITFINENNLSDYVRLLGKKSYFELPSIYHNSSVLVVPSKVEQWGLVINEAMASGLPILCSKRVGASPELVKHGVNGYKLVDFDIKSWVKFLIGFSSLNSGQLRKMGFNSLKIINTFTIEKHTRNVIKLSKISKFDAQFKDRILTILIGTLLIIFKYIKVFLVNGKKIAKDE